MALRCFCILRHGVRPAEDRRTWVRDVRRMEPVRTHRKPRGSFIVARWFLHPNLSKLGRQSELCHDSYWRYNVFARLRNASAPIGHSPGFLVALRCFSILRHGAHPAEDRRTCVTGMRRMEFVGARRRPRGSFIVARRFLHPNLVNLGRQ